MQENIKTLTIDDYISTCSEAIQPKLQELKQIVLSAAPELKEKISWNMPTFYLGKIVIQFAAFKKHIGIYPGPIAIEKFANRLESYKTSKGTIQIPNDKPLDSGLIKDIVKFNIERISADKA